MLDVAAERVLGASEPSELERFTRYWRQNRQRFEGDVAIVNRFGGKVLDVGAAPFFTTLALHMQGRDVTAVDLDPSLVPIDDFPVLRCDIEREPLPIDSDSFDVVIFSEVFEHLRIDPLFTVAELRRVLRPGGTLILSTPNLRSLRGILRLTLLGKAWAVGANPIDQYWKLRELGSMGHVREYTAFEVEAFLQGCGFEVERVVWRKKPGPWLWRCIESALPPSRPYMTVIAKA